MASKPHKILVIGDACIDRFVYCNCERLCPEAPVPVLDIIRTTENPGMAGNVIRNIQSLNARCAFEVNPNHFRITKTRYVEEKTNHMFVRIDHSEPIKRISLNAELIKRIVSMDAVVISDYNKGFLSPDDISTIGKYAKLSFLDTKKPLDWWAKDVDFININRKEFTQSLAGIEKHRLYDRIVQTLGEEGCEYLHKNYPVKKVEIKDLSGAGDTFLAALVVKYLDSKDIEKAIHFANECATKVVQKKGVSVI
jgi:bifunctional ADP-heptose synthase (sugar kinase/adenylyltransferase)